MADGESLSKDALEWRTKFLPPPETVVYAMNCAADFAKVLIDGFDTNRSPEAHFDADTATATKQRYYTIIEALRVGGFSSAWPPPLILELWGVFQSVEELRQSVLRTIDGDGDIDEEDFLSILERVIETAEEVVEAAGAVVKDRSEKQAAITKEGGRVSAIAAKKARTRDRARELYVLWRADDPYGDRGPIIERIAEAIGRSPRSVHTYLKGLE